MTAPISVIIPTLNAAHVLPKTADALLAGVTEGLIRELVISDGGSDDDTALVARELGARLIEGAPGRGGQLARGAAVAKGAWLLLLHADTHLSEDWTMEARRHIETHPGNAGWFRLRFRARGAAPRIVERGANLRARLLGLPYGDQGLLVSRRTLADVGGIPDIPLMEDVVLARRLRGRLHPLRADALTSAARYQADGWIARVAWNLGTLARFALGASPERLARHYERRITSR